MNYGMYRLRDRFKDAKRGNWHYLDSVGSICKKENSVVSIPEQARGLLPGFHRICALGMGDEGMYVCAVPEKGGDYVVLGRAWKSELTVIDSTSGLVELINSSIKATRKLNELNTEKTFEKYLSLLL